MNLHSENDLFTIPLKVWQFGHLYIYKYYLKYTQNNEISINIWIIQMLGQ